MLSIHIRFLVKAVFFMIRIVDSKINKKYTNTFTQKIVLFCPNTIGQHVSMKYFTHTTHLISLKIKIISNESTRTGSFMTKGNFLFKLVCCKETHSINKHQSLIRLLHIASATLNVVNTYKVP